MLVNFTLEVNSDVWGQQGHVKDLAIICLIEISICVCVSGFGLWLSETLSCYSASFSP